MPIDHVSYAAEPDGARATGERLAARLQVDFRNGGIHPHFGTRDVIVPLAQGRYVEVVEPLDHPATVKAPFGQAVRHICEAGGGWLSWVVRVYDLPTHAWRLQRDPAEGQRVFPDGRCLQWLEIGPVNLLTSPHLPVLVQYLNPELHPSLAVGVEPRSAISEITVAGDVQQICDWLGPAAEPGPGDVSVRLEPCHHAPGVSAVSFNTPHGVVTI